MERGDSYHPQRKPEFDCGISNDNLKKIFFSCEDFFLREIKLGLEKKILVFVCWIDGLVNETDVSEDVVRPLTASDRLAGANSSRQAVRLIQQGAKLVTSAADVLEEYGVDPRVTASLLDTCSCIFQGIIPYGAQLLIAAGLSGLSSVAIIPYLYYPFFLMVCVVISIVFTGRGRAAKQA